MIREAGFESIEILSEAPFSAELVVQSGEEVAVPEGLVASIGVSAVRPSDESQGLAP